MGMAGLAVEEFAKPFLAEKGSMHGLAHVKNVLKIAEEQRRKHGGDGDVILYAGYLHGIVRENGKDVKKFLESQRFDPKKVERILKAAKEVTGTARTTEGKVLHDAHLLEGGDSHLVVKAMTTGAERGQTVRESIKHLEEHVLGKHKCCFPENQKIYDRKESFARKALVKLKMTF
jgi:uncharacterized protein